MRAAIAIVVLAAFLPTAGAGGGLWSMCDEGGARHIELTFDRCCQSGDDDPHRVTGDIGGERLTRTDCRTCVDRPVSVDALLRVTVPGVPVRPLAFAPVAIAFDFRDVAPTDFASVLRTRQMAAGEALRAPIDSVVLRC